MGTWTPGAGATAGGDSYAGDDTNESVDGLAGDDVLIGLGGDDTLSGGDGDDYLFGDTAFTGPVTRVSTDATGVLANNASGYETISQDGRYVAFMSLATNLVPDDTNGKRDIFVKDLVTGSLTLVSSSSDGVEGNNNSDGYMAFSPDGTKLYFVSQASNLVPGDGGGIFVKDLITGVTSMVPNTAGSSLFFSLSDDGTKLAFTTGARLGGGDTNSFDDVYVEDLNTGTLTLASHAPNGSFTNGSSYNAMISPDGTHVAFESDATNLIASDFGQRDVFITDLATGVVQRVSSGAFVNQSDSLSSQPSISLDNGLVAFSSYADNLVPNDPVADTNGVPDIFVRNMATGDITRISLSAAGLQGDGGSVSPAFSPDGLSVAFVSNASNLVGNDLNGGTADVFIKNLITGAVTLYPITAAGLQGNDNVDSGRLVFSHDGDTLVFSTRATNLDPLDTTGGAFGSDIYVVNIAGDGGSDVLIGGAGNDTLNGGLGHDYMAGGVGDDKYYVDNAGDYPVENPGEGNDIIYASVSYAMTLNIETMQLTGVVPYGVGNVQDNTIIGNAAANELQGLDGNDTLQGGDGIDLLYGQNGDDNLQGQNDNDALIGGAGNDTLDGGGGQDYMLGGAGDDTYYVDNAGDNPIENPGEGNDVIYASTSYAMTPNVETMYLTGTAPYGVGNAQSDLIVGNAQNNELQGLDGDDELHGSDGVDLLYGQNGADTLLGQNDNDALIGGAGNDFLDGGSGADYMAGGADDDIYLVDNPGDNIIENPGEGDFDELHIFVSYTMPLNVEWMFLESGALNGVGNAQDNQIFASEDNNELQGLDGNDVMGGGPGNDLLYGQNGNDTLYGELDNDALIGGDGNDILNGGTGVDYMLGGTGDDTYYVDASDDNVIENPAEGTDTIYSAISYTMTANTEIMYLQDHRFSGAPVDAANGVGNDGDNTIYGNDSINTIQGLGGDDILVGGGGTDFLYGGAGADTFLYQAASDAAPATLDAIMDFEIGVDKIDLRAVHSAGVGSFSFTASGGNTFLHVDSDGNGHDDMLINIYQVSGVTSGDVLW